LVDQVLDRVVPEFEKRGFVWYPDFAGGDATQIGANDIPLQRRSGKDWPTVQIMFNKRLRPGLSVDFAALPPVCVRWLVKGGVINIDRKAALVFEGPAYFALCKGRRRNYDCNFGYYWFSLFPHRRINREIASLLALLSHLFDLFDKGIPEAWLTKKSGYVTKHVFVMGSRQMAQTDG
jgi:hypothetical protein